MQVITRSATVSADGTVAGSSASGPWVLSISSGTVLAIACAIEGSENNLTPCGEPVDDSWEVEQEASSWSTLVAVQVELL